MAIYEWNLAPASDERVLELNLVSARRRGEVTLRSGDLGAPTLVDEDEIRLFLNSFERVSLRRARHCVHSAGAESSVVSNLGNTLGGTRVVV